MFAEQTEAVDALKRGPCAQVLNRNFTDEQLPGRRSFRGAFEVTQPIEPMVHACIASTALALRVPVQTNRLHSTNLLFKLMTPKRRQ